jgi:hypothetical protein
MSITKFPKKITTATMGFNVATLEAVAADNKGADTSVLRVWGIVSGKKPGTSQFGNYIKFTGEIAAMNLITGEEARSQELLLPAVAEGIVNNLFEKAAKDGGTAEIGLELTVAFNNSAKGGTKFSYGVKPLIEYKGDDALSAMGAKLPAPKLVKALTKK